ncbi:MAG: glycosyltransferase family 4 protein [Acidimicrobiales bacterium]|nr:glycosyltransferase family 4 protein [Actinomycetota bacterium]MDA8186413.1 glycosyltransferase family 1 protein [Actinomycetota bacterium]
MTSSARVVVDADVLGRHRTGDETYVSNLLQGLVRLPRTLEIRAVARQASVVPRDVVPIELAVRSQAARMGWRLPRVLSRLSPCLAHFQYVIPPAYRGPAVVTVHDISFDRFPELEDRFDGLALRTLVPRSLKRAAAVLTVSEWTKTDIVDRYAIPPHRVVVTPNGVDPIFKPEPTGWADADLAWHGDPLARPYLLFVGAIRPRKDPVTALRALAMLDGDIGLVMVGPPKREIDRVLVTVEELGLGGRVALLGYVPRERLAALYRNAACLVLPSLYEGFGLPVVEAMASGTPVVASSVGAIPEVAGDAAVLVPPGDPGALAEGVRAALENRDRLVAAGLERSSTFSWDYLARRTLQVYEEILA